MPIIQKFILILITAFLTLPGIVAVRYLLRNRSWGECFMLGGLLGMVTIIYIGRFFPLGWLPLVLVLEYGGVIVLILRMRPGAVRDGAERPPRDKEDPLLWFVSVLAFWLWWRGSNAGILPMGFDPLAHMLIIGKILVTGHVPVDWLPFESIRVNMATGSHLFIAMISWLGGIKPYLVYKMLFAPVAFLTAGMMYMLGKELFESRSGALLGAVAWTTITNWGGMDYLMFGDFPNMAAMTLLLAMLWSMSSQKDFRRWALIGLFWTGMLMIHRTGAFYALGVMCAVAVTDRVALGKIGDRGRDIIAGLLLGAALNPYSVLYPVIYLLSGRIGQTETFTFPEFFTPIHKLPADIGLIVCLLGILGAIFSLFNIRRLKDFVLPAWTAAILLLLAFFGYLYRAMAFGMNGEFYTAFVPSRLVMDLAYPLCLAAGYFICVDSIRPRIKALILLLIFVVYEAMIVWSFPFVATMEVFRNPAIYILIGFPAAMMLLAASIILGGHRGRSFAVSMTIIVALLVLGGIRKSQKTARDIGEFIRPSELKDFNALRNVIEKTAPDALVVNKPELPGDFKLYGWLPFWAWAECTSTPLPSTEERLDPSVLYKKKWLEPGLYETIVWSFLEGRPLVFITPIYGGVIYKGAETVYESNRRKVFLYDPAKN